MPFGRSYEVPRIRDLVIMPSQQPFEGCPFLEPLSHRWAKFNISCVVCGASVLCAAHQVTEFVVVFVVEVAVDLVPHIGIGGIEEDDLADVSVEEGVLRCLGVQ